MTEKVRNYLLHNKEQFLLLWNYLYIYSLNAECLSVQAIIQTKFINEVWFMINKWLICWLKI